jgi:hypothetical protein
MGQCVHCCHAWERRRVNRRKRTDRPAMHGGSGGGGAPAGRRHSSKMVYIPLPWGYSRNVGAGWIILGGLGLGIALRIAKGKPATDDGTAAAGSVSRD